jgi:hypothetical protein
MRRHLFLIVWFTTTCVSLQAQTTKYSLEYYVSKALLSSPLLMDEHNQTSILDDEKSYLMNVYTHAQTLLTGNYLFVPIIETDNEKTSFKWNAQSANHYYGYDLGVSNGNLQYGVTWTKPLLGKSVYQVAESQINTQREMLKNNIRLNRHDIERNVIDQYVLCMLDRDQIDFADTISKILATQADFITRLAYVGQAKQSDIQMIIIEQKANNETKASCVQSFRNHLMELNALCCIRDTTTGHIEKTVITKSVEVGVSQFLTKYNLDSINTIASQKIYETKYKPQLNMFTNFGLQTTNYSSMYKNFGLSAGVTFSMLISDGKLKRIKQRETAATLSSISIYKNNLVTQNEIHRNQCSEALNDYDIRVHLLDSQIAEYGRLLDICQKEIKVGQMSVFDYITTLKNMISVRQQKMTVEANRQLATNAYNYYNW